MKGFANTILATILISMFVLTFSNFLTFFPWYMTLVYETFNLSTRASNINYISEDMVIDVKESLIDRPMFNRFEKEDIKIYMDDTLIDQNTIVEPLQRGEQFKVKLQAKFPFQIKAGNIDFERHLEVSFNIPTTGIKLYRDD